MDTNISIEKLRKIFDYYMDDAALKLGVFDQNCFYRAFEKFDNQSIDKSLIRDNLHVRIFAIPDRRIGKRRLLLIQDTIRDEPETFKEFLQFVLKSKIFFDIPI